MPELKWDTIWNTVENDYPHMDQKSSDSSTDGVPGQIWSGLKAEVMREAQVPKKTHTKLLQANSFTKWFRMHTVYNDTPAIMY